MIKYAHVNFYKDVEQDNWELGVVGKHQAIHFEKFIVEFTDTDDLKEKLADYITEYFDVWHNNFIDFVENECENNRFDYSQNEDDDGHATTLTEEYPDGYLASYQFLITEVTQKIEYTF